MTKQVTLVLPPLDFINSADPLLNGNFVVRLENEKLGWIMPPAPWRLCRGFIFRQAPMDMPAGIAGDISFGLDPDMYYIRKSGFPLVQKVQPEFLSNLGVLQMAPGYPRHEFRDHCPEFLYRPGIDALVLAPEMAPNDNATEVQAFLSLGLIVEDDFQWVYDTQTIHAAQLDFKDTFQQNPACFRSLITNIPKPINTKYRVHYTARSHGISAANVSLGIQAASGSPNMTANPPLITFSGVPVLQVPAGGDLWSDWMDAKDVLGNPLPMPAGCSLIHDFSSIVPGAANSWAVRHTSSDPSWFAYGVNGAASKIMPGSITAQNTRLHGFDVIEGY